MKWIDMLKQEWAKRGPFQASRSLNYTDPNGFLYEASVTDKNITIFVNESDIGYQFDYTDEGIIWKHPDGAEGLFSDLVRDQLNNFLKDY